MTPKAGLVLVPLLAFASPAAVQQDDSSINVISVEQIQLHQYEPRHVAADELYELALKTLGRELYVRERGGFNSLPTAAP